MNSLEQTLVKRRNIYSDMAETVSSGLQAVRKEGIRECLSGFQNNSHRLEDVGTVRGIRFINDSKATNVNATWFALEIINNPIIWIAGGQDNGNDYGMLLPLVQQKVKALVCLGTDNTRLTGFFRGKIEQIVEVGRAREAVMASYIAGRPGDVVLLSPACASFDLFDNYADRGNQYKQAVYEL